MPKKVKWGLIICGVFLLSIIGLGLATQLHTDKTSHVITDQRRPLIMVGGSNSTKTDFKSLTMALNAQHPHPTIMVTVDRQQHISATATRVENTKIDDTLIVIYFENSTDTNANIIVQTQGLVKAMRYLADHYHVKTANALGYSNGGLILSRYVAGTTASQAVPLHDLMLLGTPFLGTNARQPDRTLFTPLLTHKKRFKTLHAVINIAGDTGNGNDQVVPLSSVTAGGQLFMNEAKRYTAMTVTKKEISHTNLIQDHYLARLVRQNILNQ
ncbi:hydrolase [Lactobacillus sp. CBA3605]|uniref:alpha/beta hydrolase n=1 Tax=Lactobacillus sp. CBA3605 TaxID=2099788 RepID=UPI000CFC99A9|nr:alpha/beta hydrolase [Lactobacillus sp. CBA3605]AVK60999.1 hydrolase [Lactobacillus sp. CBA3605]